MREFVAVALIICVDKRTEAMVAIEVSASGVRDDAVARARANMRGGAKDVHCHSKKDVFGSEEESFWIRDKPTGLV